MGRYNSIRRTPEARQDRGPIMCVIPDCPHYGTISETTTHDDPRDGRWYCRHHWDLRAEPQNAHRLALEMRRNPAHEDRRHWADIEVGARILEMDEEDDHKTARQFLNELLTALGRRA